MNRLPGEQDGGHANGWGHNVFFINTISSYIRIAITVILVFKIILIMLFFARCQL